jgi:acetate kinase
MGNAIVVLNGGSSSLKFSIYRIEEHDDLALVARGQVESLGHDPHFKAKDRKGNVLADERPGSASPGDFGHAEAYEHIARWARQQFGDGVLRPAAIGHRVVHGGMEFAEPVFIDDTVVDKLDRLTPLAPLHQPHNVTVIKAVRKMRAEVPQVACFDTAFHRGRATVTERFGLPDELFHQGIRRWGFHGLSYASIVDQLRHVAPELSSGRLIVAHLGNGASLCAIKGGGSVDTTMSFSVLDGLPMGTRCGSLDPGVMLHLMRSRSYLDIERMLYMASGLYGISGVSSDVRELLASENPRAAEAIDYFCYRLVREIGSLAAALGGIDGLIFTAGIGENSPVIRKRVCDALGWLGVAVEPAANERGRGCVSPAGRSPSVWVLATDEERVIAAATLAMIRRPTAQAAITPTVPARGGRP